jgi:hypothetical protein
MAEKTRTAHEDADYCLSCGKCVHRRRLCPGCSESLCSDVCYERHTKDCRDFKNFQEQQAVKGCLVLLALGTGSLTSSPAGWDGSPGRDSTQRILGARRMSISFKCPSCAHPLLAPEDKAGQQSACPKCKAKVTVPRQLHASPNYGFP